jgi:hypothetical protein
MLQGCGGCTQQIVQQIPILLNPVTWVVALAAITGALSLGKKKGSK